VLGVTKFVKAERVMLRDEPGLGESWVEKQIGEDPTLLGLGELVLKDKQRNQPRAGRLDLLLQDVESGRRYEVEIQLGKTDESHIIRTIEYWDIERKRYPQYDHCAVIIAEEITSRFLNVISLFNGHIPLVAIQMTLHRVGEHLTLIFTKVMDELSLGLVDEDEGTDVETDRSYWEERATRETVALADKILAIIKESDAGLELKYNKHYIGLAKNGVPNNFVVFRPRKKFVEIAPRVEKSEELDQALEGEGLDVMDYDKRWGRYRVRLTAGDIDQHKGIIERLLKEAYAINAS
jgi:hypothetical protein